MLRVRYRKVVPYPVAVVLSQYYDYEHIEHVHPESLGRYVLLEQGERRNVYEQLWPPGLLQSLGMPTARSVVQHTYEPPRTMRFRFLCGRHRGTEVVTVLEEHPEGCLVDETYGVPGLPDWSLLRRLALPPIRRRVNAIWAEDIGVDVCHGGWPGVPERSAEAEAPCAGSSRSGEGAEVWIDVAAANDLVEERPLLARLVVPGAGPDAEAVPGDVVLVRASGRLFAVEARCPHSGGPLELGRCRDGREIVCPWHGARFALATGEPISGPALRALSRFRVRERAGRIEVAVNEPSAT
ncbi:MAG: Rieske (2Fe-2S) protein [Acidobacteria bacterium]|nr:MAG: Rieske (2Fe-2S) protein [Acidobacteriota bacterium]REK10644.1 MAG: Rieske (2Fe-2S) protein [Acidobacteriota bacterium]